MKNRKIIIGFIIAFFCLLLIETFIYLTYSNTQKDEVKIAFIVTGDNLDEWESMKAGAETAALDKDVSVDFVNVPVDLGSEGEQEAVLRAFNDGADYAVVATSDYPAMISFINERQLFNKVFLARNGALNATINGVVADDEAIATDFSRYISFNYNCKNILIVSSHEDVNVDTLKESLIENLDSKGIKAEYRLMSSDPSVIKKSLYNIEILGNYDGIITLDYYTMEGAASGKLRINRDIKVFSVDNSQEAVYYLDSQGINALAFKDDYSMGFLAVLQITDKKEYGNMASNAPLYYIADRENMYSDELEKVLFPFVK